MKSSQEKVKIILSLPSKYLSPNRPPRSMRGRYAKAATVKKYRNEAKEIAEMCFIQQPWDKAYCDLVFYYKINRRRDEANSVAMLKSAMDGIVDAGVLVDDSHEHLKQRKVEFKVDKECPRVEITLEHVDQWD